ncbi:recombinase family protein [Listeria seeligeri]|uniref:recombinase family protein n=1 Tax=Listeria seeligeri TaxID=1640 RepID=UPI0018874E15|nr:recombinase family protein [Listeria seeligeri]MBF2440926.1 recombinase family protein [Listeria seeligeri]
MKEIEIIKANRTITDRNKTYSLQLLRVGAYCRVSTDSEDQLNSYKSQVTYYTNLIKKNKDWIFTDIYADEAITGTQVDKRTDFQRLINDCMNGELDMVITKSISRFARNTLDTLKYVRMLKERNIAVYFEDEKINTLTMDGELLLVVLSSVAQQEVENISANVKKGLKMKMSRGELVGFQGCLGYDYHPEDKSISVNEEEAVIVKYIFNRYIEGAGGSVIGRELENLGYKTKRGSSNWAESTVLGIIKNEKYKGDILLGKTFTVDPISKRRLANYGEEDQFYLRNHHEPIITEEVFEKAQEILKKRSIPRGLHASNDGTVKRQKYSRKYAFSCMLECGFCDGTLTRRKWHSGSQYKKDIWQCVVSTKKGKKHCPHSKGIPEEAVEKAFVESYRQLCNGNKDIMEDFLKKLNETLNESSVEKQFTKIQKKIATLDKKKSNLVDMRLDEKIDEDTYEMKFTEISLKLDELLNERTSLENSLDNEHIMKKRLAEFRKTLQNNQVLDEFDRYVFESIVEKVIVGGVEEDGTIDPHKLVFIYKTGLTDSQDGGKFKPKRKNAKKSKGVDITNPDLCSQASDEDSKMCSLASDHTYRSCNRIKLKISKQKPPKWDEWRFLFIECVFD